MSRKKRGFWMTKCFQMISTISSLLVGYAFVCRNHAHALNIDETTRQTLPYPAVLSTSQQDTKPASKIQPPQENVEQTPRSKQTHDETKSSCDIFYILVSTLDGKVSALDLHNRGSLVWAIEADSKPLYSSSLANMEMIRNGKRLRVIPSLDGSLYQFDGEKVEAFPMTAETLLSSTFKLSDDQMAVGSKDLRNYGINVKTGKIQFTCGSEGCKTEQGEAKKDQLVSDDILVLTRTTQVVRSVDIKNGMEKWNFSVGQHQVNLPKPRKQERIEEDEEDLDDVESYRNTEDNIPLFRSFQKEECTPKKFPEDVDYENYLRLIVPEGKVVALDKEEAAGVRWEYKFDSPIAKAWLLRNGKVEPMSLFDGRHLPTLGNFQPEDLENESMHQTLLYIGSHEKQLYIQPSPQMENWMKPFSVKGKGGNMIDPDLKVSWRPYLNTASVRTPIFKGNRPSIASETRPEEVKDYSQALTVWHEDYPFDSGYFLYPEIRDMRSPRRQVLLLEHLHRDDARWGGLYWKERAIAATIATAVLVYFVLTKFFSPKPDGLKVNSIDNSSSGEAQTADVSDAKTLSGEGALASEGYVSRFATDFKCLHCLGKGGFGVVFEAVNTVDDQHYAVKRTLLPKGEDAQKKVLREVKALATLEHIGIVRYFNAWVESPPTGWQEEVDRQFFLSESSTSASYSLQHSLTQSIQSSLPPSVVKPSIQAPKTSHKRLPDIGAEAELDTDSIVFEASNSIDKIFQPGKANSGSGEFSVHSLSNDNSCDWGGVMFQQNSLSADSQSDNSATTNTQSSVPFSAYTSHSSRNSHLTNGKFDLSDNSDSVIFERSNDNPLRVDKNKNVPFQKSVCDTSNSCYPSVFESKNKYNFSLIPSDIKDHTIDISVSSRDGASDDNKAKENNKKTDSPLQSKCFLYIQMQLYRKDTLKEWLNNNTLNRDRSVILDFFDQIVCAVDYVHSHGLMHRDLKPSNIFFSNEGLIKVGDFGLVTNLGVEHDKVEQRDDSHTSARHTAEVGTTLYMSPEQIARKPYDFKVDIFSLGLILLEFWIPFSTQMERVRTLQDAKRQVFPSNFIRELPVECKLVRQMTSENAMSRPATKDILDHSLLKDFAPTRIGAIRRGRARTVSENSPS